MDTFSTVTYQVSFSLDTLENNLHSEFLRKLKDSLHVKSLNEVHVSANSLSSDIVLFKIYEEKTA